MKKGLILATIFFTIFLDFFNLGLIYPIFTSLVFEGNGNLIPLESSEFYKNAILGLIDSISQALPLLAAALLAGSAYLILRTVITKAPEKVSS